MTTRTPVTEFFPPRFGRLFPAREVFGVYDKAGCSLHVHYGDSPAFVDGGRTAWDVIWEQRDRVFDIAHTHPHGPDTFSSIDENSMRAIATGLGRPVRFWVLSPRVSRLRVVHPCQEPQDADVLFDPGEDNEPMWAARLRWDSRMRSAPPTINLAKLLRRFLP